MEFVAPVAAAALLATAVCLLLRRSNAELLVPLAAAVCVFALYAVSVLLGPVLELLQDARALSGLSDAYFLPVLKCVVIGLLAHFAANLCRDGGQGAMACAVELCGTAAAIYVSLPLLRTLLGLLERLL
ncbi:MAG: stage III sporulation AC/AD family protein [Oscillospiraceae bacterium]|nr:stage III sporulation AC/AD family protein [Oscillospiraceae bacterium]